MRRWLSSLLFLLCFAAPAVAQEVPRWEASAGYTYTRANAGPGECGCFSMNGGSASVAYDWNRWVSMVADFGAQHAGNFLGSGRDLTLASYLFGPQLSYRKSGRFTPFAHVLLGGAHASGSAFSTQAAGAGVSLSESAFALKAGGGMDVKLTEFLALRVFDVDYYLTRFPNAVNDRQNNLQVSAGVVFRFGRH